MMAAPLALASAAMLRPAMLRSTPAHTPKPRLESTPGALAVLQSSRAPAQLSLFGRPRGAR